VAIPGGTGPSLTIEVPDQPSSRTCPDCGRTVLDSTGFVYRDDDAFAIYHATLHEHEGRRMVDLAIGIGTWSDDEAVADASAFLAAWSTAKELQFGFVDPLESGWHRARLMSNQMTAEQARVSELRADFLAVAELIVSDDPSVRAHLG
jgi:hypothetical protein